MINTTYFTYFNKHLFTIRLVGYVRVSERRILEAISFTLGVKLDQT
nr:MAG TPA: hypothetical protein [Caudoviricetes sp.]